MKTLHERENYSCGILQDMIEREISSAFKIREPPIMSTKTAIINTIKQKEKHEKHYTDVGE